MGPRLVPERVFLWVLPRLAAVVVVLGLATYFVGDRLTAAVRGGHLGRRVGVLAELLVDVGGVGQIIYAGVYDILLIQFLLLLVILFNAVLSSVMIRTIDGGNKANTYLHFVAMTWLGCGVAMFTQRFVSEILTI